MLASRLRSIGVSAVVGALVVIGGAAAPATGVAATSPRVKPCIFDGTNLQEAYGVSVALVQTQCTEIQSGARWSTAFGFYAAKTWEQVPAGYVPAGPTPIADFQSKLVSARLVIDAGTPHEFTVVWRNGPDLWVGEFQSYAYADVVTLGTVQPLSVGSHTVRRSIVLSGVTCDGISSDPAQSCAPAGEIVFDTISFEVVP